jgi:hypothetical protein
MLTPALQRYLIVIRSGKEWRRHPTLQTRFFGLQNFAIVSKPSPSRQDEVRLLKRSHGSECDADYSILESTRAFSVVAHHTLPRVSPLSETMVRASPALSTLSTRSHRRNRKILSILPIKMPPQLQDEA